jgi:hypothetical protein
MSERGEQQFISERGEQQSCLKEENKNHFRKRRTKIMSERRTTIMSGFLFSSLRNDCCSPLSDMIVVLLSQT